MAERILIIEDDSVISEVQKDFLTASGYEVEVAADGKSGLAKALEEPFHLVLLDLMLPGVDGYEICRAIRAEKDIPILMVTARSEELDKIRGLGLGADDYIVKPFGVGELVARVRAHLARYERLTAGARESGLPSREQIRAGRLRIDSVSRQVYVGDKETPMTAKEFDLLVFLAKHPGRVFRKEELFEKIWGFDALGEPATLTVHISRLREKIERDPSKPRHIETIWGIGYRFHP
ncbi:response regulator transcription factor [Cohnella zeiphila]|uniref:Response regulator transcription factor n=1 Tax=Cohnella zeiphila TaxID=2761120 RepID=A0A7X0SNS0_9BACL|nr:response regulator transcription factor [Cohnella zeiphila]MBB6733382.1 response regulator transcription factor [Cohnella zeiphila]